MDIIRSTPELASASMNRDASSRKASNIMTPAALGMTPAELGISPTEVLPVTLEKAAIAGV